MGAQHYIRDTHRNSLIGTCLIHSVGLRTVLYTPFIIQVLSIIKVPREIRLTQPEITHCGVIFFLQSTQLVGCRSSHKLRLRAYEDIISIQSTEHNNPLQENVAVVQQRRREWGRREQERRDKGKKGIVRGRREFNYRRDEESDHNQEERMKEKDREKQKGHTIETGRAEGRKEGNKGMKQGRLGRQKRWVEDG